jgi:tRNA nucleotidyltransferase (CCA-adding enzyme)
VTRRPPGKRAPVTQVVVGHANPDFDAYAATVAATKLFRGARGVFLGSQNANVREFHNLHEDLLDFVDLRALDAEAVELVIMVDTRDPARIGEIGRIVERADVDVIVYDHHPEQEGDLLTADDRSVSVGATTSILVHEIRARGIALTPLEASVMLLGIHEDTGSLTYPSSTAYDAEAVQFLMESGADLEVVGQFLAHTLTDEQRGLLDMLLDSLELWDIHGQQVAVGRATIPEYVDSASVLTHYICEDLGYRVAIAVIEMAERMHVVARSRLAEVDVAAALKHLGGGGHPQAASAAPRDLTIEEVLAKLREGLELEVRPPLTAGDIASKPVRTVEPDTTMAEAARIMTTWGHGGLPVVSGGELVGLVTRKDVDKALRHGLDHAPVTGFMARDVIAIVPDTDLSQLERLLVRAGIGRVPIVEGGVLTGIVTRKDLLRAEHGDAYLDRQVLRERTEATNRFLASIKRLLPEEALEAIHALGTVADESGLRAHVVGGFVRDMLIGRPNLDLDIVIEGDGLAFAEFAAERFGKRVRVHRRFGTAVLVWSQDLRVDITSARTEYYQRPGALPTVERSSLRQDLFRRDFSVNAMAACINPMCFGQIADPFGGMRDLERGSIRCLHSLSFVEDPTRILRAVRFEKRFKFTLEPSTEALLRRAIELGMLDEVSGSRIREELLDVIAEERVGPILDRLAAIGALEHLLPDGVAAQDAVASVRQAVAAYGSLARRFTEPPTRRSTLVSAFGSGGGRAAAEKWSRWLRFGREHAVPLLATAERATAVGERLRDGRGMRPSRLFYLLEPLPKETLVCLWAAGQGPARGRIEEYVAVLSRVGLSVSGDDLVALGLEPGPVFSAILAQAKADLLDGKAVGREAELANVKRLIKRSNA